MNNFEDYNLIWENILNHLSKDPRVTSQMKGFLSLTSPRGVMAETIYLEVPNEFSRSVLEHRLNDSLLEAIQIYAKNASFNKFAVVVNPEINEEIEDDESPIMFTYGSPVRAVTDTSTPILKKEDPRLNPKYTFENFVIGGSNRFAHAAAFAAAESPAKAYNPLFIYGESGLGKTHLLHAIGHYAKNLYRGINVKYVSSEEFTNDFINSIANNKGTQFQNRYRNIDVLLIDDIQFLQGKAETQEAFFHTFNTLHDHNKQLVITSDLPPKQLTGFEDRMRSRFEWGLITDVQTPDLETRIAILRKKAHDDKLNISDEVMEYIADKASSNIRELEGTLIRVTAYASLNRQKIDLHLVKVVLKDLVTRDEDNVIIPVDIIKTTAEYFNLDIQEIYGSSRSQTLANARQIAMYLCRELTNLSLPKIGQIFGGRDHTTVMYAYKKISELMKEKRSVYNQVSEITNRIKQFKN